MHLVIMKIIGQPIIENNLTLNCYYDEIFTVTVDGRFTSKLFLFESQVVFKEMKTKRQLVLMLFNVLFP